MARVVNREGAVKIAKKLEAIYREGTAHTYAEIFHEGKLIAHFGIRRGSNKEQGHDHIKGDLFVTQKEVKNLALCPMSREDWISKMIEAGKITPAKSAIATKGKK